MTGFFDLSGKLALVTGASRGIGLAIAQGLAQHGAQVLVCGRNPQTLDEACAAVGPDTIAEVADVSREEDVVRLRNRIAQKFGKLDILVNNAGVADYAAMEKTTTADWERMLATNLNGVVFCCRHLGGMMIPAKSGAIINVSSIAGKVGLRRQVPYCVSKGGVEQLTRALAIDWAEHGIRVNAIGYGFIETDMTADMTSHPHIAPKLLARTPLGRFGKVSEVAGAAVFLASPSASYVTGHTLMVDGGWTAG